MVGFGSKVFCHERQPPILWKSRSRTGEEVQPRTRVVALCWWCPWPLGACVLASPSPFHSLAGTLATLRKVIFQLLFVVPRTTRLLPFSFLLFVWWSLPAIRKGAQRASTHPPSTCGVPALRPQRPCSAYEPREDVRLTHPLSFSVKRGGHPRPRTCIA